MNAMQTRYESYSHALAANGGREPHRCEYCDHFFLEEPVTDGLREFCSDDCLRDYLEDVRVGECEARREYELYGDDLDSWFR